MRKNLLLAIALFSTLLLSAKPVTPERALRVAGRVLNAGPQTKASGELKIIWDGESGTTKSSDTPAFYVVGREGGGFVIVAGDDRVRPVLGLSYENPFEVENMPCNVSAWMDNIKAYCRETRTATARVQRQWAALTQTKAEAVDPALLTGEYMNSRTVQWGQQAPSNMYCPIPPGYKSVPCGCVALVIAEIMTWFGYPEKGSGFVSSYTYETKLGSSYTVKGHELGTVYDWATLQGISTPEQFKASNNTEAGKKLGQLVYDVATLLQIKFDEDGSSGNASTLADVFSAHMGYSKTSTELWKSDYPEFLWDEMLKEEIEKYPIFYRGSNLQSNSAHAYVFDGYAYFQQSDLVFHVNFGWSGSCNGYYYSEAQATSNKEVWEKNAAVFGFYPDPSGATVFPTYVHFINSKYGGGLDYVTFPDGVGYAQIIAHGVKNGGPVPIYGEYGLRLAHMDGTVEKEPLAERALASVASPLKVGYYLYNINFSIMLPSETRFGDRIAMYYRPDEGEDKPLVYPKAGDGIDELPLFPAAFIYTEAQYHAGDPFYFRLTNQDYTYADARWYVTAPSGETSFYVQSDIGCLLATPGKYTIKAVTEQETIVTTLNVE